MYLHFHWPKVSSVLAASVFNFSCIYSCSFSRRRWSNPSHSFSWLSWGTCQHMDIHSADCSPNDVAKGAVNCPYSIWMNEKVVITLGTYNWVVFCLYLSCVSEECHIVVAVDQTPHCVIDSTMDGHWFIHWDGTAAKVSSLFLHLGESKLASNPGFPFWILSRSFGEKSNFSPKLRDKIWNGKPGFKAKSK